MGSVAAASDVTDGAPPELTSLSSVEEGEAETEAVAMSDAKMRHHYCADDHGDDDDDGDELD